MREHTLMLALLVLLVLLMLLLQLQVTGVVVVSNPAAVQFQLTSLQVVGQLVRHDGRPEGQSVTANATCSLNSSAAQLSSAAPSVVGVTSLSCPFSAKFTLQSPKVAVSIKIKPVARKTAFGGVLVGQVGSTKQYSV